MLARTTVTSTGPSVGPAPEEARLLDSYTYGFALQEAGLPFDGSDTVVDIAEPIMERFSTGEYPHLVEMATGYYLQPGYDFADEFEWGLDLILDAITNSAALESPSPDLSGDGP